MELSIIAIIITIIVGILTIITGILRIGRLTEKLDVLIRRHETCPIVIVQSDIQQLKAHNELFWKILGPPLAGIIHSPEHKDRDDLVDKLLLNDLTLAEAFELKRLLELNISSNHDKAKILGSAFFLWRTEQIIYAGDKKCTS